MVRTEMAAATNSTLPDSTSRTRDDYIRLRAWARHEPIPHPELRRGAIYLYHFNEDRVQAGEPWKTRPVILMNENPLWRLMNGRPFHVVPLSTHEADETGTSIAIHPPSGDCVAITALATTINPKRLGSYLAQMSDEELDKVSKHLKAQIEREPPANNQSHVAPANVFEVDWHDPDHAKAVCVLGSQQLYHPTWPAVQAAEITVEDILGELSPEVRSRPLAQSRFEDRGKERYLGTLDEVTFGRLRHNYIRSFGL